MEIHVPSGRPHSWKNFLIELGTITAGVLVALMLESLVEQNHYRMLVNEARETITRELTDNEKEMRRVLAGMDEAKRHAEVALQMVSELLATKKSSVHELGLSSQVAELGTASWQTADRTGALSHMPYAEVQKYSKVYGLQELYTARQRQSLDRLAAALSLVAFSDDPTKASPEDLRTFRSHVLDLRASQYIEEQFGKGLLEAYQKLLSGR